MIQNVLLNGKPAYKISAVMKAKTPKALLLDCEGDEVWVPRSVCKYFKDTKTALILDWWYNQNFE